MGICPICGCYIDPGEPCCPECGFVDLGCDDKNGETVSIDGREYPASDVEDVLGQYSYDLDDLEGNLIDEDDMELILDDLERL